MQTVAADLELFSYFRSSTAYRLRIALNLKGIDYRITPINLLKGEQRSEAYLQLNPQGLVPALRLGDGRILTQSMAILEWLEVSYPQTPLYPDDSWQQAQVRSLCMEISCDIHPLNNLRILKYLVGPLGRSDEEKTAWYHHWLHQGFRVLEAQLPDTTYAGGEQPNMVDVCLIPQLYNAYRFGLDMTSYPRMQHIYHHCNQLDAFIQAAPEQQPDAV
ncbi:maleylacetoacetate isomerase [Pokkaliibacter plantistimulans]|uniref:Maleylacetoacetate isomerase n=1 Tax=Proteobacteria bacterium 228 TaxID=2083153 RepID=A0A2S5KIC1_9PROT|nr:maleylacetoacetate isomerase [Pokkaliibacter plantistimulans]PPC74502.1 maleylacetoacetate isomerase [Pokkaliibacter plantistimulans]